LAARWRRPGWRAGRLHDACKVAARRQRERVEGVRYTSASPAPRARRAAPRRAAPPRATATGSREASPKRKRRLVSLGNVRSISKEEKRARAPVAPHTSITRAPRAPAARARLTASRQTAPSPAREGGSECTVETRVGATVGRGGASFSASRKRSASAGRAGAHPGAAPDSICRLAALKAWLICTIGSFSSSSSRACPCRAPAHRSRRPPGAPFLGAPGCAQRRLRAKPDPVVELVHVAQKGLERGLLRARRHLRGRRRAQPPQRHHQRDPAGGQ